MTSIIKSELFHEKKARWALDGPWNEGSEKLTSLVQGHSLFTGTHVS